MMGHVFRLLLMLFAGALVAAPIALAAEAAAPAPLVETEAPSVPPAGDGIAPSNVVKMPKGVGPVLWATAASAADLERFYPPGALSAGIEGRVVATCTIQEDLSLDCPTLESDEPGQIIFDDAVRNILKLFRARPTLTTGAPAAGTKVRVPLRFKLAD